MSHYIINGGRRLEGTVRLHGAKNATLPILAAATICGDSVIANCPCLTDVEVALDILRHLGCDARREEDRIITTQTVGGSCVIPDRLMGAMRSSIVFLGAMISRFGCAQVTLPGGCELGSRPIDLHLSALRQMGAEIHEDCGALRCSAPQGLHGADITLSFPSVGATENILIAAAAAKGETILRGAAREPEIGDLIAFLKGCGGDISTDIDGTICIRGVSQLHGTSHRVIPDRIAGGTYLCAGAITNGEVELEEAEAAHLLSTLAWLHNAGCRVNVNGRKVWLRGTPRLRELGMVKTAPYPGFPTDMQAILMAVAAVAQGTTVFVENIFDGRYRHIPELRKLGCDISVQGRVAVVNGGGPLHGAPLRCTDLRGGAAVVLAAMAAEGESQVEGIYHIDRGYECMEQHLAALGGDILRTGR